MRERAGRFRRGRWRLIDKDGEPWWVLADVCRVLEIANSRDAAGRLDPDEKDDVGIADAWTGRSRQPSSPSPASYKLIMTSRKRGEPPN
jgi:prophage antirepressor-like protein